MEKKNVQKNSCIILHFSTKKHKEESGISEKMLITMLYTFQNYKCKLINDPFNKLKIIFVAWICVII
jgi:hypothetical protein